MKFEKTTVWDFFYSLNVAVNPERVLCAIRLNGLFGNYVSCFEIWPYLLNLSKATPKLLDRRRRELCFVGFDERHNRQAYFSQILRR